MGCGYCFYKYRSQKAILDQTIFHRVLAFIRPAAPVEFIFSGGEPLIEAELLKQMIAVVKQEGLSRYLSVQTNATLLDPQLMSFFVRHGVNLEIGIDGDEETTRVNRPGLKSIDYQDVLRGVKVAVQSSGKLTTTVVVRPSGAMKLMENVKHVAGLGLSSIEVHPAFLEDWDRSASEIFIDQYRQLSIFELKTGQMGLIGRGYSMPSRGSWDFLLLPSGKVLGNWLLLSFPEDVRERLYLMDFEREPFGKMLPQAKQYFNALGAYVSQHPYCSYRCISNFNARYAAATVSGHQYEEKINCYIDLCHSIEAIDRKMIGGKRGIDQV